MLLEFIIAIITAVSNVFIGVFAFLNNKKSATHALLALLSIIIGLWTITNYLSLHSSTPELTLFWIRAVMLVTSPLGPTLFLLVHTFPNSEMKIRKPFLFGILALMSVTALLAATPLMFKSVTMQEGLITPQPGPAIGLFAIDFVGLSITAFALLIRKFLKAQGVERTQLKYFLLGVIIMFSIVIVVFISIILTRSSLLVAFGPMSSLILIGFIMYAIVKHEFLNIKVLATQLFTVLIWIILGSRLFVAQSVEELLISILIFLSMIVFGLLLIQSVIDEVKQKHELAILNEKLKELDARKNDFINIAAHELRAPMTAIKGYISMLLEGDAGKLPDSALEYLKIALESNDRLVRLVNNMLNASRIEENRQVYQMGIVSFTKVVKAVYDEFVISATEKGLEPALDMPVNLENDKVYVDQDRIHEVVSNLISNAVKYTDQGTVSIKVSTPASGFIRLEVTDSGRGMAIEDQQRIFQKYYRVDSAVGRKVGTGLGLYVSKLLVEKFGGKIGFTSVVGKGSTFWVELPIVTDTSSKPNILV